MVAKVVKRKHDKSKVPKLVQTTINKAGGFSKPWKKQDSKEEKELNWQRRTVDGENVEKRDKNDANYDTLDNQETVIKIISFTLPSVKSIASAEDWEYLEGKSDCTSVSS